jgi:hypothetical protein
MINPHLPQGRKEKRMSFYRETLCVLCAFAAKTSYPEVP